MIANKDEKHHSELLNILENFSDMWDRHLGRITIAKPRNERTYKEIFLVHSASYRAGPTARMFAAMEIVRIL